ncbi:Alpha/Beta hydrolase protein [Thelonectria olida]|uniref:Alpha/Beta hydrolase protein n=1 Tax=Thelonectria olida TaxID=1576542 RepID=A0A9P8WHX6_9HYPO|nr:Alpha/Beta hydrolase protein [Thelonectria olida]
MDKMHHETFTTNDGCTIAFQSSLNLMAMAGESSQLTCMLLMHGFSGSSAYFKRNYNTLTESVWVVAPDMRGHGKSDRTRGGYHVARLAADLAGLVKHLRKKAPMTHIIPVGCSIGAAVIWTYIELFGCTDFAGFVFVDQAPLQDRSVFDGWDQSLAHTGCYDEASMLAAQQSWINDSQTAHLDLVKGCLGYCHAPQAGDNVSKEQQAEDERFFTNISALCDQTWLARLLADHTRYDHREAIETITLPTLVMAGRRSGCFPLEGMLETVRRVERKTPGLAKPSVFEAGHWLFYEEPERFNRELIEFAQLCKETKPAYNQYPYQFTDNY